MKTDIQCNPFPKQTACKGTERKRLYFRQLTDQKCQSPLPRRQSGQCQQAVRQPVWETKEKTAEGAKRETDGDKFKLQHCVRDCEDRPLCNEGISESKTFTDIFVRVQYQRGLSGSVAICFPLYQT